MITQLDLKILREFDKIKVGECLSTWNLMKKIFKEGKDKENNVIKYQIEKMAKLGLFNINGKKIKTYTMDSNKVYCREFSFPCGRKKGIAVFIDGKWRIYEL